jgi:hypothetical protein
MKAFTATTLALAVAGVRAYVPLSQIKASPPLSVVSSHYVVEVSSMSDLSARRAPRAAHAAVYESLHARSVDFTVKKEYDAPGLWSGATIELNVRNGKPHCSGSERANAPPQNPADLEALAATPGIISVRPVALIPGPKCVPVISVHLLHDPHMHGLQGLSPSALPPPATLAQTPSPLTSPPCVASASYEHTEILTLFIRALTSFTLRVFLVMVSRSACKHPSYTHHFHVRPTNLHPAALIPARITPTLSLAAPTALATKWQAATTSSATPSPARARPYPTTTPSTTATATAPTSRASSAPTPATSTTSPALRTSPPSTRTACSAALARRPTTSSSTLCSAGTMRAWTSSRSPWAVSRAGPSRRRLTSRAALLRRVASSPSPLATTAPTAPGTPLHLATVSTSFRSPRSRSAFPLIFRSSQAH